MKEKKAVYKDCFAYSIDMPTRCIALTKQNCPGCNFYKTSKQKDESDIKTIKRLKSLGYPDDKLIDLPGYREYQKQRQF